MPSATEHAQMLARLLPQGPAWATSDQTDGEDTWTKFLAAFGEEPARVDAAALLLLNQIIPDNDDTDLDAWERIVGAPEEDLSDAERLARIQAHIYGRRKVNRSYLEQVIQAMAGDTGVKLYHRVGPAFAVGLANVGDASRNGPWNYTWLCELYGSSSPAPTPDTFASAWSGFVTVTDDVADSPVTLDVTGAQAELGNTNAVLLMQMPVGSNETVYSSFWIRNASTAPLTLEVSYLKRDNTSSAAQTTVLQGELQHVVWHKITYEASVGSGGTTPALRLRSPAGTRDVELSWCVLGIRDAALEARIEALFPIHTRGHFGVLGEYETLLSHADQLDVIW
jgi:uncharacterized protein YmfQ (DUF2313 family)